MTYERPNVDGLLLAKLRELAEQLVVTLPWRDAEKARLELEDWIHNYFGGGQSRPLRLVLSPKVKSRTTTARCYAAGEDLPPDGPPEAA